MPILAEAPVTGMPRGKTLAVHFAVLVLFSVLAVLMTLRLAFHLGDALPDGFGDPQSPSPLTAAGS